VKVENGAQLDEQREFRAFETGEQSRAGPGVPSTRTPEQNVLNSFAYLDA
jgi:hypothetical protein